MARVFLLSFIFYSIGEIQLYGIFILSHWNTSKWHELQLCWTLFLFINHAVPIFIKILPRGWLIDLAPCALMIFQFGKTPWPLNKSSLEDKERCSVWKTKQIVKSLFFCNTWATVLTRKLKLLTTKCNDSLRVKSVLG